MNFSRASSIVAHVPAVVLLTLSAAGVAACSAAVSTENAAGAASNLSSCPDGGAPPPSGGQPGELPASPTLIANHLPKASGLVILPSDKRLCTGSTSDGRLRCFGTQAGATVEDVADYPATPLVVRGGEVLGRGLDNLLALDTQTRATKQLATNFGVSYASDLRVVGSKLYFQEIIFASYNRGIGAIDESGVRTKVLSSAQAAESSQGSFTPWVRAFAIDGDDTYFVDSIKVQRAASADLRYAWKWKDVFLVPGSVAPTSAWMTVDETFVYLYGDGRVYRHRKDGFGDTTTLLSERFYPRPYGTNTPFVFDGKNFYFIADHAPGEPGPGSSSEPPGVVVLALPKGGGELKVVARGLKDGQALVGDGTNLYWLDRDGNEGRVFGMRAP